MPSELWTLAINGGTARTFAELGLADGVLSLVNQQADTLALRETLPTPAAGATTAAGLMAWGDTVTLRRDGVVWFVGKCRAITTGLDNERRYLVRGAWDVLERRAYLQNFVAATDPSDPDSDTATVKRGRVVLCQADDGLKVSLATFLAGVITYAGLTPGTIGLTMTVPFEDATDLSCADVITRLLRWVPNAVVWFDYTTSPATVHIQPRAELTAATLALGDADGLLGPVNLTPRYDLVVDHVCLQYLATNRSNAASWEEILPYNGAEELPGDLYPEGTTGEEDGALVRTIELAGSVWSSSYLTQRVETDEIYGGLSFSGTVTSASNPSAFSSLSTFWRTHVPALAKGGISILGFRNGTHTLLDGTTAPTADLRELVEGALTDWMLEDDASLITEAQLVTVKVVYEVTDPTDSAIKTKCTADFTAQIVATNAATKTYSYLADSAFTPGEEVPTGLAEALYDSLNPLQWEGDIVVTEEEATDLPAPGEVVNITGDRAEYATMAAMVQARTTELATGRTTIQLGPPKQLGPADLVEVFRQNRNRRPSTSYLVRATGKTGGAGGGVAQGLPVTQPIRPSQGSIPTPPRTYTVALTVAGVVPTSTEIATAVGSVYSSSNPPVDGDTINLTVGGATRLRASMRTQGTASGIYVVAVTVGGVDYYAHQVQTGLY